MTNSIPEAEPVELDYAAGDYTRGPRPPLNWAERAALPYLAIVLPAAGLAFNFEPDAFNVPIDWRNGQPLAWLTLFTLPEVGWPLWPFLLAAWAALLVGVIVPRWAAARPIVSMGLVLGLWLGLLFAIVVAAGLAEGGVGSTIANACIQLVIGVGACFLLVAVHWIGRIPFRRMSTGALIGLAVGLALLLALGVGLAGPGSLLAGVFGFGLLLPSIGAAPASVVAHGRMLLAIHKVQVEQALPPPEERERTLLLVAGGLTVALHALSLICTLVLARNAYAALPATEPQRCFVATAASRSRRSRATKHRQLRTLRAFESLLAARVPTHHARLRGAYNRMGPRLAACLTTPGRAAVAHVLLWPFEELARRLLSQR